MMRKIVSFFISSIVLICFANAQNVDFKASNFKDKKDEFKTAVSNIDQGDDHVKLALTRVKEKKEPALEYKKALELYLKAQQFNSECADLNYKIGKCYLQTFTKTKAIPYLEKAVKYDPSGIEKEAYFLLGEAYQYDYKFEEAKKQFKLYKEKLSSGQLDDQKKEIDKKILECESGIKLMSEPKRVWVTDMDKINTEYDDYGAAITADESMMIFNSKRPGNLGDIKDDNDEYYSDIYVTTKQNGVWLTPVNMGEPLNTFGSDECEALSPDGQKMFICRNMNGNYDLYISTLNGDKWSVPEKLPKQINTEFNETNASFSYDGIKRYYISDQQGSKDIFFSGVKDAKLNEWGQGQKIGFGLNTPYDEGSIWMHPDGNTLYFASKGFNSMGGYDIFKSVWQDVGQWSTPVNMGYPINSPYDDIYFVMSANGKHAYISSNRKKDSKGDFDIFKVQFLGPEKPAVVDNEDQLLASFTELVKDATPEGPVNVETMHLTVLRGRTLDSYTNKPVEAEIEIVDNVKNQIVYTTRSNSLTGKFLLSLPAGVNYGIAIKADKYLFYSENFDLPKLSDYQLVDKDIYLKNVCIGCTIVLRNIFFDFGKTELRPESNMELKRLLQLLKDIPQIKVEISGHTDNVGNESFNLKLSEDRAKAVVSYLVKEGIPATRLVYKGYGSSKPIAANDREANRQLNRRTEFKIIEN